MLSYAIMLNYARQLVVRRLVAPPLHKWPLHTILHTNFIMLQIMLIMLNYAVYANLCLRDAQIMLNALNYANYALCSDSAIMPKAMLA